MAPEQLAGGPATVQSDIYALGLVLYEVFTGRQPYPGTIRGVSPGPGETILLPAVSPVVRRA